LVAARRAVPSSALREIFSRGFVGKILKRHRAEKKTRLIWLRLKPAEGTGKKYKYRGLTPARRQVGHWLSRIRLTQHIWYTEFTKVKAKMGKD